MCVDIYGAFELLCFILNCLNTYNFLELDLFELQFDIDTIVYDDACHLKRFAANVVKKRKIDSPLARRIAELEYAIDRFHFKNHVDKWCKVNCNPSKMKGLEKVRRNYNYQYLSSIR